MKNIKFLLLIVVCFAFFACVSAQDKQKTLPEKPVNKSQDQKIKTEVTPCEPVALSESGELKTLAEGSFAKIEEPFLFVARTGETYAQLKNILENLPSAAEIDFDKQAVVAAFAGTKNTGGYSVEIKNSGGKISIVVNEPPAGAIVTEALTMPYKVAVVPVQAENPLDLTVSENWTKAAQTYKVSTGNFEYSGGIAGRSKSFAADGTIAVYRFGDLVTLDFNLSGENNTRKLTEMASGYLKDGKIVLESLNVGSFSEGPKPPVKVLGTTANDKLSLSFEPLPSKVADGFQARGKLETVKNK